MSIYMISYDLNSPGQRYKELRETIESLGTWCHYLESTYLVKTSYTIHEVESKICAHLDGSDRLLLCKIEKPIRGWLSDKQWEWIRENL